MDDDQDSGESLDQEDSQDHMDSMVERDKVSPSPLLDVTGGHEPQDRKTHSNEKDKDKGELNLISFLPSFLLP